MWRNSHVMVPVVKRRRAYLALFGFITATPLVYQRVLRNKRASAPEGSAVASELVSRGQV